MVTPEGMCQDIAEGKSRWAMARNMQLLLTTLTLLLLSLVLQFSAASSPRRQLHKHGYQHEAAHLPMQSAAPASVTSSNSISNRKGYPWRQLQAATQAHTLLQQQSSASTPGSHSASDLNWQSHQHGQQLRLEKDLQSELQQLSTPASGRTSMHQLQQQLRPQGSHGAVHESTQLLPQQPLQVPAPASISAESLRQRRLQQQDPPGVLLHLALQPQQQPAVHSSTNTASTAGARRPPSRRLRQQHGTVLDLDSTSFDAALSSLPPAHPVVMEFYASWCPACRLFASTYAEVGSILGTMALPLLNAGGQAGNSHHQTAEEAQAGDSQEHAVDGTPTTLALQAGDSQGQASEAGGRTAGSVAGGVGARQTSPLVGRVDCAKEPKLCASFRVPSYPYVTAGTADVYLRRLAGSIRAYPAKAPRPARDIVRWAAQTLELDLSNVDLSAAGVKQAASQQALTAAQQQESLVWTMADVESATVYLYRQVIMADAALHSGADKRQAQKAMLQLWAAAHPSPRCQGPAQKLAVFFDHSWPQDQHVAPAKVREYKICGNATAHDKWVACAGSSPGARGYTCGLWLLFHTCAQRLSTDGERGKVLMTALNAFNQHFFRCELCQRHFAALLNTSEAAAVRTQRDAVLWLWRAHNEVNTRLMKLEAKQGLGASGDPAHPKQLFPSRRACPECWAREAGAMQEGGGGVPAWQLDAVYAHLDRVYMSESPLPTAMGLPLAVASHGAGPFGPLGWARPLVYIVGGLAAVVAVMLLLLFACNAGVSRRGGNGGGPAAGPVLASRGRAKAAPL